MRTLNNISNSVKKYPDNKNYITVYFLLYSYTKNLEFLLFRFNNITTQVIFYKNYSGCTLVGLKVQLENYLNFMEKFNIYFYNENTKFNLVSVTSEDRSFSIKFFENVFIKKKTLDENLENVIFMLNLNIIEKFKMSNIIFIYMLDSYFTYMYLLSSQIK